MRRRFLLFRNFHTKLFVSYSLIIILLTVAVAVPTYYYLKEKLVRNQNAIVEQVFNSSINNFNLLESQFDNYTKQMYLIRGYGNESNDTLVEQLAALGHQTADKFVTIQSVKNFISLGQEINKDWDRINIILQDGTIFSNKEVSGDPPNAERERWIDNARRLGGAVAANYSERDPYSENRNVPVFALSRLLQVGTEPVGVMQIQIEASRIFDPAKLSDIPFDQFIIYSGSSPIYSYPDTAKSGTKSDRLEFYRQSQSGHFTLYMTVGLDRLYKPIRNFQWVMIAIVSFLVLFSLLIYYFLARILTSPLKKIRSALDSLQLSGDDESAWEVDLNQNYYLDEMERLNRSFRKMNARLQQSLNEIVHFRNLQLQSRFDLLQSQINPHFLFNMLGVIQVLSDHNESRLAADLCIKLAEFLKYTIGDNQTKVPMKEEFHITEMYLELMKSRYRHRLEYRISLPEEVADIELPKLIIQPLVENSLKHGFKNLNRPMLIEVGARMADDRLTIEIKDNGSGFEPHKYGEVMEAMKRHGDGLSRKDGLDGLSVGGMGIASTYLRLKLLYGERIDLRIDANDGQGAIIRIQYTLPKGKEALT
ncbi:sensor histidine kinase [Cohnella silvisoli]|uniref:Histidine kinase n=1 Tax=Cohnella silvisoli TaxID=2873699 RepID=A0ABV1KQH0_9BACL|nr:histidine kinase [Cohnella silvisoli]MCD9022008.1 histidine kinase [Cohnella silvisoli]